MKLYLTLFLAGMLVVFSACQTGDQKQNPDSTSQTPLPENQKPGEVDSNCFLEPNRICETGLQDIRLGDYIADFTNEELPENAIQDSLENGNGYTWLVRTIHLPEGQLIVEGNFLDEQVATEEKINSSTVNRIRIETPAYQTGEGIKIGTPFSQFLGSFSDSAFYIVPIPEFNFLDLSRKGSHIHFLIQSPKEVIDQINSSPMPLSLIPPAQPIESIVIM